MTRDARMVGLAMLLALGCTGPDISYGENAVVRPRNPAPVQSGGRGGSDVIAGSAGVSGVSGVIEEPPPDFIPPIGEPDGSVAEDASTRDAAIDGAVEEADPSPYCAIPFQWIENRADGDGSISGCGFLNCVGDPKIEQLDTSELGLAFSFYDPVTKSGCTAVVGDLIVHNYLGRDLTDLACLEVLTGSLTILNAPFLESLDGLENLTYVGGNVWIGSGPLGLVGDVSALERVDGLRKLEVVLDSVKVRAPALASLEGLHALRAVAGNFELVHVDTLVDLLGLDGLRGIGGDFLIDGAAKLTSLAGADQLELIAGSFQLWGTPAVRTSGAAFPHTSCVGDRIALQGTGLEQLDFLPALERVGGDITLSGNRQLQSIDLGSVKRIAGTVSIQDNAALEQLDLGTLERLGGVMVVTDNPKLEECPLVELAGELGRTDGSQIRNNARTLSSDCPVLTP